MSSSLFVNYIYSKIKQYNNYILVASIIIIFIAISVYAYLNFYNTLNSKEAQFKDVANNGINNGEIDIMMFHVDWCPYCKKALPDWQAFCDTTNTVNINGFVIRCDRNGTDCTNDANDPKIAAIIKEYKIESYPTVIILKNNKRYEFDAKVTKNALDQFVSTVANAP